MIKFICQVIWAVSETFSIPLGRAAPWVFEKAIGRKGHKVLPPPPDVLLADEVSNVPRREGFGQVCVWPGFTVVDPDHPEYTVEQHVENFQDWMSNNFSVRVQFLEEIAIQYPGGEAPFIVFAVHNEDVPKFVIPRLHFGIRWIEDATDPGNGPRLPRRFLGYRGDRQ